MRAANDVVSGSSKKPRENKEETATTTKQSAISRLPPPVAPADSSVASPSGKAKLTSSFRNGKKGAPGTSGYDQSKKQAEEQRELEQQKKPTRRKTFRFGGSPKCPICGKSVYFAEQMKALGETFHKQCFKCAECSKVSLNCVVALISN